MVEDPNDSAVPGAVGRFDDVESLEEGGSVAIYVEDAVPLPAVEARRYKPILGEVQSHGIKATFRNRNRIAEVSDSSPLVKSGVRRPCNRHHSAADAPARGPLIRQPELSEMIAKRTITGGDPNRVDLARDSRQDLDRVEETPGPGKLGRQAQEAVVVR